jgi:hypothetical protein
MNLTGNDSDARKANLLAWAQVLWRSLATEEPNHIRLLNRSEPLPAAFSSINLLVSPQNHWAPLGVFWSAAQPTVGRYAQGCGESLYRLLGPHLDVTDVEAELPGVVEAPWAVLVDGAEGQMGIVAPLTTLDRQLAPAPQSGFLGIPTTLPDAIQGPMLTRVIAPTEAIFTGPLGMWSGTFTPDAQGGSFHPLHRVDTPPAQRLQFAAVLQEAAGSTTRRCLLNSQGVSEGYRHPLQVFWMQSAADVWALRVEQAGN